MEKMLLISSFFANFLSGLLNNYLNINNETGLILNFSFYKNYYLNYMNDMSYMKSTLIHCLKFISI